MSSDPSGNKISASNGSIHDELEILFEETVDLANRLKKQARHTHRGEQLSASGRILLQSLQLQGAQTVPALAHIRSTSRQNIQVLVNRLAAAGFIEFVSNPGHKRSDLVQLTDAGRGLLSTANEREASLLATLLPHTTEAEVRSAAELLRKLRLLLGGERKRRKANREQPAETHEVVTTKTVTLSAPAAVVVQPESSEEEWPVNLL
jgi:DNA-binding MarR family transcriptional regulator